MKRRLLVAASLSLALVACQTPTSAPTPGATVSHDVRPGIPGATIRVSVVQGFRTQGQPMTTADVANYRFELRDSGTNAVVATLNSAAGLVTFTNVDSGTYYATVDALDASNASIVQGGAQPTANTVTVSGMTATYSSGASLTANLTLLDGTGGLINANITYGGGLAGRGGALVPTVPGPAVTAGTGAANPFFVDGVPDGSYHLWAFAQSGGLATPARLATGTATVTGGGFVSGSFSGTLSNTITRVGGGGTLFTSPYYAGAQPFHVRFDGSGNLFVATGNNSLFMKPRAGGTYYGQAMTANQVYLVAGGAGAYSNGALANGVAIGVPEGMAFDSLGNLYFGSADTDTVRMVPRVSGTYFGQAMAAGRIYTVVGTHNTPGAAADDVPALGAFLNNPLDMVVDGAGNLIIADTVNARVRMVPVSNGTYYGQAMTAGNIYTIAGGGVGALTPPGPATAASLTGPYAVEVDGSGNVFMSLASGVYLVASSTGTVFGQSVSAGDLYRVAGGGGGGDGSPAIGADLTGLRGLAFDASGNLLIAHSNGNRLRVVPASSGTFYGQAMTAFNLYTIAGTGAGGDNGDGRLAAATLLLGPEDVAVDSLGNIAVADTANGRVRIMCSAGGTAFSIPVPALRMETVWGERWDGDGSSGSAGQLFPHQLARNGVGWIYAVEPQANRVRMLASGSIVRYAGTGSPTGAFGGDGGPLRAADFNQPHGIALDSGGNPIIADTFNHRIRRASGGIINTIIGNGVAAFAGDGGPAASAQVNQPRGLAYDSAGHLYIADAGNGRIRMVPATTGTYFGQAMTAGNIYSIASGLSSPSAVAINALGNVFVANTGAGNVMMLVATPGTYYGTPRALNDLFPIGNVPGVTGVAANDGGFVYASAPGSNQVRMIAPSGVIYTVAGTGVAGSAGDGGQATSATLSAPNGLVLLPSNILLIAETNGGRVRQIL